MGNFIATLGGFLMIGVLIALIVKFLRDMGLNPFQKGDGRILILIPAVAIVELMICGIYVTSRVGDISLLDIRSVFADTPMLFDELYPFNWYFSIICGIVTVFGFFRLCGRNESAVWVALAFPFSWFLFLPFPVSWIAAAIILVLNITDKLTSNLISRITGMGWNHVFSPKHGITVSLVAAGLAICNSFGLIKYLGV